MSGHHLILGELVDFVTGETRPDTHDERYRQKIARLLVESKGYDRESLRPRVPLEIHVLGREALVRLDLTVFLEGQTALLVKYAPGSLTTRHQVALAASKLLGPFQVPFSVVTNGEDADVLDNRTASVIARGLDGIFPRQHLEERLRLRGQSPVTVRQRDMAARILYAYEVDGRCPCDDTVCEFDRPAIEPD